MLGKIAKHSAEIVAAVFGWVGGIDEREDII
jgi:hypothetical protein